jgi:ABC-type Fe3+ transport system permease subunit
MTAVRAMLIAAVATSLAGLIVVTLRNARPFTQRIICVALATLFLMPAIMVGFAYGDYATLQLIRHPWLRELLYTSLMIFRLMPVAVLVIILAPRRMSDAAVHAHRLATLTQPAMRRMRDSLGMWLRGDGQVRIGAAAMIFLLAFGEHQIASLLQIDGWTVWLFDLYVGGLPARTALVRAIMPMSISLAAAMLAFILLARQGRFAPAGLQQRISLRRGPSRAVLLLTTAVLGYGLYRVVCLPMWASGRKGAGALLSVMRDSSVTADIAYSLAIATAAGVAAFVIAMALTWRRVMRFSLPLIALLCACGLLSEIVLAFGMLALFRRFASTAVYDSSLPLLLGLVMHLLPFALAWRLTVSARSAETTRHVTRLYYDAADRRVAWWSRLVLWSQRLRSPLWAMALLAYLGYVTLTLAAVLSPSGHTPVMVTLYNLMHYGQDIRLAAMVLVTASVPAALLLAGLTMRAVVRFALSHG